MSDHRAALLALLVASLACAIGAFGGTTSSANAADAAVQHDIRYGDADGTPLLMDVYGAGGAEAPTPGIVVVHGGGFYSGDKSDPDVTRVSRIFAALGYVAFNVDYRLAPQYPYPAANDDVRSAVAYVRQHAASFGVDPDRIAILGSSAGSTLAAWVAYVGHGATDIGSRVDAVVTFSGAFDLPALPSEIPSGDPRVNPLLPGHGYLTPGPELQQQAVAASPITYVDPSDPPILMVNSRDEHSPLAQPQAMLAKLRAAHVPAQVLVRPGSAHALSGPNLGPVLLRAAGFLDRELHHQGFAPLASDARGAFEHRKLAIVAALLLLVGVVQAFAPTGRDDVRARLR